MLKVANTWGKKLGGGMKFHFIDLINMQKGFQLSII